MICPTCRSAQFRLAKANLPELRFGLQDRFSIYRCVACGTYGTYPQPERAYLDRLYSQRYVPENYQPPDKVNIANQVQSIQAGQETLLKAWTQERSTEIPALFYQPQTRSYFADKKDVLDVGAYTGENMLWLSCGGWNVTGVELNPVAARIGQELGLDIQATALEENTLPSASFDVIYMSYVIEHLLDPHLALKEMHRLLRQGGRLLLTTHNVDSVWRYVFGPYWINWHTPFHIWHFSARTLTRMVEQEGFKIVYLTTRTPRWWLLFSIRAARDGLHYHQPNKHLFEPMTEQVGKRLLNLLKIEKWLFHGDCTIAIFAKLD
jgi:SAM-dependent methyltransferase